MRICARFADEVRLAGVRGIVMLIPMRDLLGRYDGATQMPFVVALRAREIEVLDLSAAFVAALGEPGSASPCLPSGHPSPRGNELVARKLARCCD